MVLNEELTKLLVPLRCLDESKYALVMRFAPSKYKVLLQDRISLKSDVILTGGE